MTNSILVFLTVVTLSLKDCKDMAETGNLQMKNAALSVGSAREQKSEALLEYFPKVQVSALSFHSLNPLLDIGLTDIIGKSDAAWEINNAFNDLAQERGLQTRYRALQSGYGATVSAIQPLYAGGRIVNGNALAALGVKAAELQQEITARETGAAVEEKYWLAVSLERKRTVVVQSLETLDAVLADVDAAVAAGVLTSSESSELRQRRRELQTASVKLKGGCTLAKMDLLSTVGMEYQVSQLDSVVLSDSLSDIPSPEEVFVPEDELQARMQEMQLLDLKVEAEKYKEKMMVGETLPQVGVGVTYGYGKYLNDPSGNGLVFVSVSVPLSDWGKTAHRIRRYGNEVRKAANERDYYQSMLLLKARQLWVSLGIAWDELDLARSAADKASEEYRHALAGLDAGTLTTSEMLRTQLEMRQAKDALADAQISYRKALAAYLAY